MSAQTASLFLLEDLEDVSRTKELTESDLNALRAVADWIKTFVARPHEALGRAGPVCPSCLGPWNVRHFGSLLSRPPTVACQMLSSS